MSVIDVKNLSVVYRKKNKSYKVALKEMSATFTDGMNVIVGYSGCGKTTLLRSLLGLTPYTGQVILDGANLENVETKNRRFSYVSQEYALYPQFTVFDNIAFPLKLMGADRQEITKRVYELAELTELTACLTRKPKHISGGQQQRTAIARALIKRPVACLLDEPFSNLDEQNRTETRRWVKQILAKIGCMGIYVTHDFAEALVLADKLFVMNDGRLEICGTSEEIFNSHNEVVETLMAGSFL